MVSALCVFGDPNPQGPEDAETAARELLLIAIIGQHSGFNQCVRFQPASLPLPTTLLALFPKTRYAETCNTHSLYHLRGME